MRATNWLASIGAVLSPVAAWLALRVSLYNTHTLISRKIPRGEMVAVWDLPRNVPQASKGPGLPATYDPRAPVFRCEIIDVEQTGVRIRRAQVRIDMPPRKRVQLRLPENEQPRKLNNGDSQIWPKGSFDCHATNTFPDY